jgi:hypothetical protein
MQGPLRKPGRATLTAARPGTQIQDGHWPCQGLRTRLESCRAPGDRSPGEPPPTNAEAEIGARQAAVRLGIDT